MWTVDVKLPLEICQEDKLEKLLAEGKITQAELEAEMVRRSE